MAVANHKIKGAHCGLSGHVSHSTQTQNFHSMIERRVNKIEVMRKHGTLKHKAQRHPLRAEKTPRRDDLEKFDFSIPTGRKELKDFHRWDYPEVDFGLMGKFQTQKHKYDAFADTQKDYIEKMKSKAVAEKAQKEELERVAKEIAVAANIPSARGSAREDMSGRPQESARSSARSDVSLDLHGQPIRDFRILGSVQPEVLAKFRAERAQEYLQQYGAERHPLDPPPMRTVRHKASFHAGGTTTVLSSSGVVAEDENYVKIGDRLGKKQWGPLQPTLSPKRAAAQSKKTTAALTKLINQLDATESDIRKSEARLKKLNPDSNVTPIKRSAR